MRTVMATLAELLDQSFNIGQVTSEIVASVIVFGLSILVGWILYLVFERYIVKWARGTETKLDDEILRSIKAPILLLVLLVGVYYGLGMLTFLTVYSPLLALIFMIAEILIATFVIARFIDVIVTWYARKSIKEKKGTSEHILFILKRVLQFCVYVFAFLAILAVFRVDLSGVVIGFGVGGIAIALALQAVLSDAFSAFSIYFDRPFEIGDFIVVGDYAGTVKHIGIKSTRLKLLQGEELIVSNKELTTSSIRNFKKMRRRRIVFTLQIACDTSIEKLRRVPQIISEIIEKMELATLDRVHFKDLGEFSLNFEVVYYMRVADYTKYMDTQQAINYEIVEAFEKENIEMAFPTQTILLNQKPR